jgi:hypothetical protein
MYKNCSDLSPYNSPSLVGYAPLLATCPRAFYRRRHTEPPPPARLAHAAGGSSTARAIATSASIARACGGGLALYKIWSVRPAPKRAPMAHDLRSRAAGGGARGADGSRAFSGRSLSMIRPSACTCARGGRPEAGPRLSAREEADNPSPASSFAAGAASRGPAAGPPRDRSPPPRRPCPPPRRAPAPRPPERPAAPRGHARHPPPSAAPRPLAGWPRRCPLGGPTPRRVLSVSRGAAPRGSPPLPD